jgi:hypothetical protein
MARRATKGNENPAGGEDAANEWERRGRFLKRAVAGTEQRERPKRFSTQADSRR